MGLIQRRLIMNKRIAKKKRKRIYRELIEDVALEISLDSYWRHKIFDLAPNQKLLISYCSSETIPVYIRADIARHELEFYVYKIFGVQLGFDMGLIIFGFCSKEYPNIKCYTGNNPNIV